MKSLLIISNGALAGATLGNLFLMQMKVYRNQLIGWIRFSFLIPLLILEWILIRSQINAGYILLSAVLFSVGLTIIYRWAYNSKIDINFSWWRFSLMYILQFCLVRISVFAAGKKMPSGLDTALTVLILVADFITVELAFYKSKTAIITVEVRKKG